MSAEGEGLTVSRNDLQTANHRLDLRPVTRRSAPGGFNTRFEVTAGGATSVRELGACSSHGASQDNVLQFGLGPWLEADVTAHWQRGGSTRVFRAAADQVHLIHETVIEVNGAIHGTAAEGTTPDIRLLGEPGAPVFAFLGVGPGPFELLGATFDLLPYLGWYRFAILDADGEGSWAIPLPPGTGGLTIELQLAVLDLATLQFEAVSGVSSIEITP